MVKARNFYIFEGPESFAFRRGYDIVGDDLKTINLIPRGIFNLGKVTPVKSVDEMYIGTPKKLVIGNKIKPGWKAIRVGLDFLEPHAPYIPDIQPQLVSLVKTLRNQIDIWRRMYNDEKRKNLDRESKDRLQERLKKDFKFHATLKQFQYGEGYGGYGGGFGIPYYRGYSGLGYAPPATPPSEE